MVAHAILSPYGLYLYLYCMYVRGCTYRVTLNVQMRKATTTTTNPKTLAGQGEEQFFHPSESTLVQICLCLTPLCVYGMHPNHCAHVKDPIFIFICQKRVRLAAHGIVTQKHRIH